MSFCPSNIESFPFIFDPETFEKKMSMLPSNHDDLFSTIHQNFSKILTDTNLDAYANTSDFGVPEFSKIPQKSFMPLLDDQQTALDFDGLPGAAFKNNSRTPRAFGTGFGFSSLGFNQNDINPAAALMNNAAKGSLSRQLGFAGMPQLDYTSGRGMTEIGPQFDTMDNLTMKDFPSMHDYETLADDPLGLAWNNNGGSFKDTKNIRKQSGYMYGDNILNMDGGYNMPVGIMNESTGPSYTKTEPTSSGQSAQSQSNIVKKGEPMNKKKSGKMESVSEIQPKKTDANPKGKDISPTQGKYNKFSDDEDDRDDFDADGKGRSSKGLRVLSLKVKDIVIEKKRTTYKEVATALIKELGGQNKTKSQGETKDEQNVKRRVYDALNVLIATGVLQKEGKTVTCAETASSLPVYSRKEIRDKKDLIEDKIAEAKRLKKQKLESLHEFLYKTLALKNLIKRNKDKAETEMLARKLNKNFVSNDTEGSIKFPFLVIQSSTGESSMNVNMDASQKELLVESKHELNVSGDIDVLIKMGLHHVSSEFFEKNIPQGLQKHVPKAFLNKLQ